MKFKDVRPETFVKQLRCDRCGREANHHDLEFHEFTCIAHQAGYASVFGDGNQVEIDLCQRCLQETLGPWLRVGQPEDWEKGPPGQARRL